MGECDPDPHHGCFKHFPGDEDIESDRRSSEPSNPVGGVTDIKLLVNNERILGGDDLSTLGDTNQNKLTKQDTSMAHVDIADHQSSHEVRGRPRKKSERSLKKDESGTGEDSSVSLGNEGEEIDQTDTKNVHGKSLVTNDSGEGESLYDDVICVNGGNPRKRTGSERSFKKNDSGQGESLLDGVSCVNGENPQKRTGSERSFKQNDSGTEDESVGYEAGAGETNGCETSEKNLMTKDAGQVEYLVVVDDEAHHLQNSQRKEGSVTVRSCQRGLKKDDFGNLNRVQSIQEDNEIQNHPQLSVNDLTSMPTNSQKCLETNSSASASLKDAADTGGTGASVNYSEDCVSENLHRVNGFEQAKHTHPSKGLCKTLLRSSSVSEDCLELSSPHSGAPTHRVCSQDINDRLSQIQGAEHVVSITNVPRPTATHPQDDEHFLWNSAGDPQSDEDISVNLPALNLESITGVVIPMRQELPRASQVSRHILDQMSEELLRERQRNQNLIKMNAENNKRIQFLTELCKTVCIESEERRKSVQKSCQNLVDESGRTAKALADQYRSCQTNVIRLMEEKRQCYQENLSLRRYCETMEEEKLKMKEQLQTKITLLEDERESLKKYIETLQQEMTMKDEQHKEQIDGLNEEIKTCKFEKEKQELELTQLPTASFLGLRVRGSSAEEAAPRQNSPSDGSLTRSAPEDVDSDQEDENTELKATFRRVRHPLTSQHAVCGTSEADEDSDVTELKILVPVPEGDVFMDSDDDETVLKTPVEPSESSTDVFTSETEFEPVQDMTVSLCNPSRPVVAAERERNSSRPVVAAERERNSSRPVVAAERERNSIRPVVAAERERNSSGPSNDRNVASRFGGTFPDPSRVYTGHVDDLDDEDTEEHYKTEENT